MSSMSTLRRKIAKKHADRVAIILAVKPRASEILRKELAKKAARKKPVVKKARKKPVRKSYVENKESL
jgi:hypothetical protein